MLTNSISQTLWGLQVMRSATICIIWRNKMTSASYVASSIQTFKFSIMKYLNVVIQKAFVIFFLQILFYEANISGFHFLSCLQTKFL